MSEARTLERRQIAYCEWCDTGGLRGAIQDSHPAAHEPAVWAAGVEYEAQYRDRMAAEFSPGIAQAQIAELKEDVAGARAVLRVLTVELGRQPWPPPPGPSKLVTRANIFLHCIWAVLTLSGWGYVVWLVTR